MPQNWFASPHPRHRAYIRWQMCKAIAESGGLFPIDAPKSLHYEVASMFLDALLLAHLSESDIDAFRIGSFDVYGDGPFTAFRRARASRQESFDDLMTELAYGGWEKMNGTEVTPPEVAGSADMLIRRQSGMGAVIECKRLTVTSSNRMRAIVRHASGQIAATASDLPGLLVIDISASLQGAERDNAAFVGDSYETVFSACLRGPKNRSVSAILLVWDHFEHERSADFGIETLMQRRSQVVTHVSPRHPWPRDAAMFDGLTTYSQLGPGLKINALNGQGDR